MFALGGQTFNHVYFGTQTVLSLRASGLQVVERNDRGQVLSMLGLCHVIPFFPSGGIRRSIHSKLHLDRMMLKPS